MQRRRRLLAAAEDGETGSQSQQHPFTLDGSAGTTHGRLVTFFRNGDRYFKGLQTAVSRRLFATVDTLSSWLAERLELSRGVRYIFALPEGRRIVDIREFVGGKCYVASSVPRIEDVPYGEAKVQFWRNTVPAASASGLVLNRRFIRLRDPPRPEATKKNGNKSSLPASSSDGLVYVRYGLAKSRMLVIRSNTHRASQIKMLFNPRAVTSYEELLESLSDSLQMDYPPITSLYTGSHPFRKVTGISHMMKGLRTHYEFLAVGGELVPLELSPDPLPPIQEHPDLLPLHRNQQQSPVRLILPPKQPPPPPPPQNGTHNMEEYPSSEEERPRYQRPGANPWKTITKSRNTKTKSMNIVFGLHHHHHHHHHRSRRRRRRGVRSEGVASASYLFVGMFGTLSKMSPINYNYLAPLLR